MKSFLFSCVFFCSVAVFADVSRQQADSFAAQFAEMFRSDKGTEKLKGLVNGKTGTNGQVGWWENFWLSETNTYVDPKELEVNQILIREPDLDNPTRIKLTDDNFAKCLIPPEKIAVIYFNSGQKDIRAVLIMALVSSHGKIMLSPMVVKNAEDKLASPVEHAAKEFPPQKNLSTVPGVEIIKVADDNNCYGFPKAKGMEKMATAFATNPLGCSLRNTVLYLADPGVWVKGLNYLPSGRFKIHCQLLAGERGSVENKLLNALASTFDLNIKVDDHYIWNGYQVSAPNPLPACFRATKEAVGQSAMHGVGNYEGYSLEEIISNALHNKPFDLLSTNTLDRYDVRLDVWPETYGEITALEKLGFGIIQTNLQRKTLVINAR